MKRIITAFSLVLCAALLFAGCSHKMADMAASEVYYTSSSSGSSAEYKPEAPMASAAPEESIEAEYDASYGITAGAASDVDLADRFGGHKVILTYEATIRTDTFDSLLEALTSRVNAAGGYMENTYIDGKKPEVYGEAGRTASLSIRVPAEKADAFFSDVKTLGTLISEHAYTEDVTEHYFDRETRLEVLNTQLDRLRSILVETDNLADVIALETEIARVMLEIESLTGELRRYDALIDYATVNLTVYENSPKQGPVAEETLGDRIAESFADSIYGIGTFFTDALVWFIGALPVFALLALIILPIVFIIRAIRKKKARKKAEKQAAMANNMKENNRS
ncbi:MAG: DUF4349 domain-containing protein [Clostridiales bacterium]|nr:DUF4349 domain-containing protein [Clostridiales bacterium]